MQTRGRRPNKHTTCIFFTKLVQIHTCLSMYVPVCAFHPHSGALNSLRRPFFISTQTLACVVCLYDEGCAAFFSPLPNVVLPNVGDMMHPRILDSNAEGHNARG